MDSIERVYVVSDLHLGGRSADGHGRGFQLNTHGSDFANFVKWTQTTGQRVELVLNGDTIDFLAEEMPTAPKWRALTSDPADAALKLTTILRREQEIVDALRTYMTNGHRLVIILGNHDIELSFPQVRDVLRNALGVSGHDFTFIHDGEAYQIDDVLIEHGNLYDDWNYVDHSQLLEYRSGLSRFDGSSSDAFSPPVGSTMVASVINPIKERYAFVDLLKPETEAVVPVVLSLDPGYAASLTTILRLAAKAKMRRFASGPALSAVPATISDSQELTDCLTDTLGYLEAAEFQSQIGLSGNDETDNIPIPAALATTAKSMVADLFDALRQEACDLRLRALLTALRRFHRDKDLFSHEVETASEYLLAAKRLMSNGARHVIFGHTHIAKKVHLLDGCCYFNSGTWANVLEMPSDILTDDPQEAIPKLRDFVEKMRTNDFSSFTTFRPTYVVMKLDATARVTEIDLQTYATPRTQNHDVR